MTAAVMEAPPATDSETEWRVDCLAYGETRWAANRLTFPDQAEAESYARGLYSRWTLLRLWRSVPVGTPEGEQYVPGTETGPVAS